jgi:hypothetical protein
MRGAVEGYIGSYAEYATRIAQGDYNALFDSPMMSMVVQSMLGCFPEDTPPDERMTKVAKFFSSDHFAMLPYQFVASRIFAKLRDMVKGGAFANRENALQRLSGFFQDVKHVATYGPYCDAFVMDQPMAALVTDSRVGIEVRYGVKIFSLNNWDELFAWLDALEATMTDKHKAGLSAAYP